MFLEQRLMYGSMYLSPRDLTMNRKLYKTHLIWNLYISLWHSRSV